MYLTKLLLRDFGKFHNDELNLAPGINVVEGAEGSGKSTVAKFISGILYGVRRPSDEETELFGSGAAAGGEGNKQNEYDNMRPEGRSGYSGTGYIKADGKSYLVDRTFLTGGKTSVLDVQSGREVQLKDQDSLAGTLIETDKNAFKDTCIISGLEDDGNEEIAVYLGNKLETGTGSLNKRDVLEYLEAEKAKNDPRPLIRRLENLDSEIETYDDVDQAVTDNKRAMRQLTDDFAIEAAKRKRVARQMVENEDGTVSYKEDEELGEKIDRLTAAEKTFGAEERASDRDEDDEDEEKKDKKKLSDNIFVIFLTGIFVVGVIAAAVYLLPFEDAVRKLFIIFTAIFVVITILFGFKDKGYFDSNDEMTPTEEDFNRVLEELEEERDSREELEFDMTFAREFQEKKDILKAEEKVLMDRKNKRDRLRAEQSKVFKKKSELEEEIKAINLAISTVEQLSQHFQEQAAKTFVPYLSEYVDALTGHAYGSIVSDAREGLCVEGYSGRTPVEKLPKEMADRVYLAMRLSIAKHTMKEQLPLVIDDAISFATPEEAQVFLMVLKDLEMEQIVILTKDALLSEALKATGMQYNYVQLA